MSVTVTLSTGMEQQLPELPVRRASGRVDLGDNIRNGIPKLSTLAKWKAGFSARERAELRKKEGSKRANRLRRSGMGAPPTEDVAGSASEKQQSGPGVFGLELPRPPPSTRNAPPVPSQPVELPFTSTVPVTVPISKLERVRQMEFRSSKQVKAREIPLSKTDVEKLRTFSEFVGTPNQIALFGRQLPQCHRYAVQLELDDSKTQTYICIEGLRKNEDIRDFYAVMSQKRYRKYYEPWKICFRMVEVSKSAASASNCQDVEEVPISSQIILKPEALTLCGALVKLYALTTAHSDLASDSTTSTLAASPSPAQTLKVEDLPDEVGKILILDYHMGPQEGSFRRAELKWEVGQAEEFVPPKIYEDHRDDWCLIPLPQEYQLPNIDLNDITIRTSPIVFSDVYTEYPGNLSVRSYSHSLGQSYPGVVAVAPSFLDGECGTVEVWAVIFNEAYDVDFIRGGSGSWFFTLGGSPNVQVVGTAVARSPGKAFITLLSRQFDSISRAFPTHTRPVLPDPVLMLLRAVKHFHQSDRPRSHQLTGLLFRVLQIEFPPDQPSFLHRTLQTALMNWEQSEIENLRRLIKISGEDLEATLERILEEQSLDSASDLSTAHKLAFLYRDLQMASHPPSLPLYPPASSATQSHTVSEVTRPTGGTSTFQKTFRSLGTESLFHLLTLPYLTAEPPGIPPPSVSQPDPTSTSTAYHHPQAETNPNRTTLGLTTSLYKWLKAWSVVIFTIFLGLSYWAGIGVGAWKLLTSDLGSSIKIGVRVGLIAFHVSLLISYYACISLSRRRRIVRYPSPGGASSMFTDREEI
ncbi:hypothetical protein V8F33_006885 [Rhypophila sp. PSN 637]